MESDQCPAWMGLLSAILDTKLDNRMKSLEHKVVQVMQSHRALLGTMRIFFFCPASTARRAEVGCFEDQEREGGQWERESWLLVNKDDRMVSRRQFCFAEGL